MGEQFQRIRLIAIGSGHLLALLCGCGGVAPATSNGLPKLSGLETHAASLSASATRRGIDTYLQSDNNQEYPPLLGVQSGPGETGWAIYQLDPPTGLEPQSVEVRFDHITSEAWIGLANFTAAVWQFSGPVGYGTHSLNVSGGEYLSPGGHLYLAVVAPEGYGALIENVTLKASDGVANWQIVTVDNSGAVGGYTSMALVNGKPAISYSDFGSEKLKYAYSSNANGSAGWTTVIVDNTALGLFTSLAVINGKPAISYEENNNGYLKYAYSSTLDGSAGWTKLILDNGSNIGYNTSLALVNNRPAIAYYQVTGDVGVLKYAYSSLADGSGGWTNVVVDSAGNVGSCASLEVVDGKPAVSYYDRIIGQLKYAYSSSVNGGAGWATLSVDSGFGVDYDSKCTVLGLVNGKPAISYFDSTDYALKYAHSSSANGSAGWSTTLVDNSGEVGDFNSLAVINGNPAICYYDSTNGALMYAHNTAADSSGGWQIEVVEYIADLSSTSLMEVNGNPAISYMDAVNWDLKYAVRQE